MKPWMAVMLAALLTACGLVVPAPDLTGDWQLQSGTVRGEPVPMVPGNPITLTAEDGELGGTSACNHYGGSFSLDGRAVSIGAIHATEMACAPNVMASEAAYLDGLSGVERVAREGDLLVLSGPHSELRFQALPDTQP